MNSRERFITALTGGIPDRVPIWEYLFSLKLQKEVIKETMQCLKIGMPGGGYILSTDHSLHDDIPLENARALIDTVMNHGNYSTNV